MACDYQLGKFTFLDELEPELEPQHCIRLKKEIPETIELGVSSDEFLDARSLSMPSSPTGGTDCPPTGGKGDTDGPLTGGKGDTDGPSTGGKGDTDGPLTEGKGDTDCPPTAGKGGTDGPPAGGNEDTYCTPVEGDRKRCPPGGAKWNITCPPEAVKRRTNGLTNDLESPIKKLAIFEEFNFFDKQTDSQLSKQQTNNAKCKQPIHTNTCKQATNITPIKQTSKLRKIVKDSILSKQPTTAGHKCHWYTCTADTGYATLETLYDHVLASHIAPCEGQDVYMCQWEGCKVYNVPSSSYNGYKGHVLRHTKAKMHRCLIEECPASFRTIEGMLYRN